MSYAPVLSDEVEGPNYDMMRQNLVGPSAGDVLPTASSVPMLQVVAPATLPEGYEFEAAVGESQTIKVKVPLGGVEAGQTFQVPFPQHFENMISGIRVPVGHWRDGLCDCCAYGACHPHCWTSYLCPLCKYIRLS